MQPFPWPKTAFSLLPPLSPDAFCVSWGTDTVPASGNAFGPPQKALDCWVLNSFENAPPSILADEFSSQKSV